MIRPQDTKEIAAALKVYDSHGGVKPPLAPSGGSASRPDSDTEAVFVCALLNTLTTDDTQRVLTSYLALVEKWNETLEALGRRKPNDGTQRRESAASDVQTQQSTRPADSRSLE